MTNTKDIIIKLKEVREEKKLSFTDILSMMESNGDYLAKSTLSRVFSDGSEEMSFKYEETIRPIANALLDIDHIEDNDILDVQALKTLLQYKNDFIRDLSRQLDREKIKSHEELDKERERSRRSIDFLKNQIELKDKRMDQLLDEMFIKDKQQRELLQKILNCPCREKKEI